MRLKSQAKITYTAGLDWTLTTDPIVRKLKTALAGMARLLGNNANVSSGVSAYELVEFYKIEYDSTAALRSMEDYLQAFRLFRMV
jgi:hypothetical protein